MRLLVLTLLATVATANQYCSIRCRKGTHTLCKYNADVLESRCQRTKQMGFQHTVTDAEKQIILNQHNSLRRKVAEGRETNSSVVNEGMPNAANMMELEWDDELAKIAQGLANTCKYGHDDCRDTSDGCYSSVGQNIAQRGDTRSDHPIIDWDEVIGSWYSEVNFYRPSRSNIGAFTSLYGKGGEAIGHFTQVVWANTHRVGCGFVRYYGGKFYSNYYVCNYAVGGNINGKPVYEVGKACSKCPKNSKCINNLCKLD